MKALYNKFIITTGIFLLIVISSCKKTFLNPGAIGGLSQTELENKAGVNGLLIGAYSLLDGWGANSGGVWKHTAADNWIFGGVGSDDAHKGSEYGDNAYIQEIESYTETPITTSIESKWQALYAGVERSNDVLKMLAKITDGSVSADEAKQIEAEARFLRAVFHFEAVKMWENVPYIDETVSFDAKNYFVPNTTPIMPKIEADLQFAADNLAPTNSQVGRANSWAAKAFLAKAYMFDHKFTEAKTLLTDIIANGETTNGLKYALLPNFYDNFDATKKNNSESVFAVQMSISDNSTGGQNGNFGDAGNYPSAGPGGCCGFYQPSFSLVNSFRVDPTSGLPLLDTWNNSDVKNDEGIASSDPFTPSTETLDPRLDWTVGRRGIPYLDWGLMPGATWIVSQSAAGPYLPVKNIYFKKDEGSTSESFQGWQTTTSKNYVMIRFADVLLWAAECEVEIGSLDQAETYVNMIRNRAANKSGWVKADVANGGADYNGYAANYLIKPYPDGDFAAKGQSYAREAVRFERKLEFAMEGHRFFDLQRYDNGTGYMADVLNAYIQHETHIPGYNYLYMNGAHFTKGKNEVYPIPQAEIDLNVTNGASVLKQNPGY